MEDVAQGLLCLKRVRAAGPMTGAGQKGRDGGLCLRQGFGIAPLAEKNDREVLVGEGEPEMRRTQDPRSALEDNALQRLRFLETVLVEQDQSEGVEALQGLFAVQAVDLLPHPKRLRSEGFGFPRSTVLGQRHRQEVSDRKGLGVPGTGGLQHLPIGRLQVGQGRVGLRHLRQGCRGLSRVGGKGDPRCPGADVEQTNGDQDQQR